ncbi:MAG TPA: helical backbone metal receptor [Gemmatimonadaceae bacterium]
MTANFGFGRRLNAISIALAIVCASCRSPDSTQSNGRAPRDDFGALIDVRRFPRRIVSLNPTTTEVLFAIGASSRLVGRSQWDVFPDSARFVPSVGQALRPNVEAVVATHPDLVLLYASADNRAAFDRLRGAGIPTVAFKIDSVEQFVRDTRLIGVITGDSVRAASLADSVQATLARVRAATASLVHPTVFMPAWDKPIIAIGGGSFLTELLEVAGAHNVYADISAPSGPVTLEDVVRRNPDIVLAAPVFVAAIRSSPSWRTVPAIRKGRLMAFDTLLVGRPSATLGAAAVSLADLLHPGALHQQ